MPKAGLTSIQLIENSEFFSRTWYSNSYPDVAISGLSPAEHYLRFGGFLGRDPSPRFSTSAYLNKNPDVERNRMNALCHYEKYGRKEGRDIYAVAHNDPLTDPAILASRIDYRRPVMADSGARKFVSSVLARKIVGEPVRLYQYFNDAETRKFVDALASLSTEMDFIRDQKVTVIMPTYNRADKIELAIRSVLNQSHENIELIVVDDGSNDETPEILKKYDDEPRMRVFWNKHTGVSCARNTGLENATGEVIFYLDSDNTWTRDFVRIMLLSLKVSNQDCAYGASRLQHPTGHLKGYRGEPFNWQYCVQGNYIDMNVFCHRRCLVDEIGVFDTALKRMVDWDLILRYTKGREVIYVPIIGCIYLDDSDDPTRITTSQPYVFRKIVQQKNLKGLASTEQALQHVKYNIALKIPAPFEARAAWGDYHYAESLKSALIALGHKVRIDFHGKWYDHPVNSDDIAIVLRGLTAYKPRAGQLSLMWNISHPDQVSYDEYRSYHGVFIASDSYAALLSKILERDIQPLLQCSDTKRFAFDKLTLDAGPMGVFVGNSRKEYRSLVKWSVLNEVPLDVYGQHWEPFIPASMIKGQNIDNTLLHKFYSTSQFVLNDHWNSMKDFGFVSNRVFDVLSCGGRLVSDYLPSIPALFGDAVVCVKDEREFSAKMSHGLPAYPVERRKEVAEFVQKHHSFDARAETICAWVRSFLSARNPQGIGTPPSLRATIVETKRHRVGLILQQGKAWPTSSAFIRLIAPLTTDEANTKIDVIYLNGVDDPQIDTLDSCIVQRVAVTEMSDAQRLIDKLAVRSAPLFVDTDDAFFLHAAHAEHDKVLRILMSASKEVWFSTPTLAQYYDDIEVRKRVIPNSLDPRFWLNYRKPVNITEPKTITRFVYMGTATHDEDFKLVYPAFEKLAQHYPDTFTLTLVGAVRQPPKQKWIKLLLPPVGQGSYPIFIRWLMNNSEFDVGIAPLQNSKFNLAKSDIKFLDYSAAGLLSLVSKGTAYESVLQRDLAIGCEDEPDAWYKSMVAIIEDPHRYISMRQRAIDYVWQERSTLQDNNPISRILTQEL